MARLEQGRAKFSAIVKADKKIGECQIPVQADRSVQTPAVPECGYSAPAILRQLPAQAKQYLIYVMSEFRGY